MVIGDRLREIRELRKLSQGDIGHRTDMLPAYISRIENGHTVPSVGTLEKFARALEVPMYQLFYDGENPPKLPKLPKGWPQDKLTWGATAKQARMLHRLRRALGRIDEKERLLLLSVARKMSARSR